MNALNGITSYDLTAAFSRALNSRAERRATKGVGMHDKPGFSEPEPAKQLPVSKPVGESGAAFRSVDRHNSFLRMFVMESSHLPAQLRRAGGMHRVTGQDLSFKVMVLPGGSPVAVGGSAKTDHRAADGRQTSQQELAYVSFLRRFITSSASLISGVGSQSMPLVQRNTDNALSAIQVLNDLRMIGRMNSGSILNLLQSNSTGALEQVSRALTSVGEALGGIEVSFRDLANRETFTEARVTSSSPLFVTATASRSANAGAYGIEVLSRAEGHQVQSDQVASGAMGLNGSFKINGHEIVVGAGDALFDLAAKINYGEDLDHDGELDAGEDGDGDFRLDGGTAQHGVHARFFNDRLVLESQDAGGGEIQIEDDDSILETLGVIAYDGSDQLIFKNQIAAAGQAMVRVDGKEFRSSDNIFTNAINGVEFEVLGVTSSKVELEVSLDAPPALDKLRPAVEEFNTAIRSLNRMLDSRSGALAKDPAATRIRAELVGAVLRPVAGQPEELSDAGDAGLERAARSRAIFSEEQLASAARGNIRRFAHIYGVPTVFNTLDELGILAEDDDTLTLDENRFRTALEQHPEDVADLFTRAGEGIAVRVLERAETALGRSGLLALRKNAIESLRKLETGHELARSFQQSQHIRLLSEALA